MSRHDDNLADLAKWTRCPGLRNGERCVGNMLTDYGTVAFDAGNGHVFSLAVGAAMCDNNQCQIYGIVNGNVVPAESVTQWLMEKSPDACPQCKENGILSALRAAEFRGDGGAFFVDVEAAYCEHCGWRAVVGPLIDLDAILADTLAEIQHAADVSAAQGCRSCAGYAEPVACRCAECGRVCSAPTVDGGE